MKRKVVGAVMLLAGLGLLALGYGRDRRLIDSRSYWLGCVVGSLTHVREFTGRAVTQEESDRIGMACRALEIETRKGVGE